jgi:hypothetical protein
MKEKASEVYNYFKSKLLNGEFSAKNSKNYIDAEIDGFVFHIRTTLIEYGLVLIGGFMSIDLNIIEQRKFIALLKTITRSFNRQSLLEERAKIQKELDELDEKIKLTT